MRVKFIRMTGTSLLQKGGQVHLTSFLTFNVYRSGGTQMDQQVDHLVVGEIVNTHGVRGEVKIYPRTDFPDIRFEVGNVLYVMMDDGERVPLEIAGSRPHKNVFLVRFVGYDNINEVLPFKGRTVTVPADERIDTDEEGYYYHEIIGCTVLTEDGKQLGKVEQILKTGANDVWEAVDESGRSILIPVIDDVVLEVDVEQRKIWIQLLEGML